MKIQRIFRLLKRRLVFRLANARSASDESIYWDEDFAEELETWGKDHVWLEIQALLAGRQGRVLDIACGSGEAMLELRDMPDITAYGCDFSDLLISRGRKKNLTHLVVSDATRLAFPDQCFDYSYSIGSLEHFREDGIERFLAEASRVTCKGSFHMIPLSRDKDQGWITPYQSYYNNSQAWWMPRFKKAFRQVYTMPSGWSAWGSIGKWFICIP
jgi:ubiquinone/menaquinone biosynthesis C-methylase UbiE